MYFKSYTREINRRIALIFAVICFCCLNSCSQYAKKKSGEVNIDSLLHSPVALSDSGYSITNVEFVARYGGEARKIDGSLRDRFLQFQDQHPKHKWEATNTVAAFTVGDTTVFLALSGGHNGKLSFLVNSWGNAFAPKVRIKAQMIISKYLRYGVRRDFLVKEVEVIKEH